VVLCTLKVGIEEATMTEAGGDGGVLLRDVAGNYYLIGEDVLERCIVTDDEVRAACDAFTESEVSGFVIGPMMDPPAALLNPAHLPGVNGDFLAFKITPQLGLKPH
jgi:hypothetical protein